MPCSINEKELKSLLGIINYLGKLSPATGEVCEPLETDSSKDRLKMEQHIPIAVQIAKVIIKDDVCMRLYNENEPLYL